MPLTYQGPKTLLAWLTSTELGRELVATAAERLGIVAPHDVLAIQRADRVDLYGHSNVCIHEVDALHAGDSWVWERLCDEWLQRALPLGLRALYHEGYAGPGRPGKLATLQPVVVTPEDKLAELCTRRLYQQLDGLRERLQVPEAAEEVEL